MAVIRSLDIYTGLLDILKVSVQNVIDTIEATQVSEARGYTHPANMESEINNILSGLNNLLGTAIAGQATTLATSIEIWGVVATQQKMTNPRRWTSTAVDVDDGASGSTLTVNQDVDIDIFVVFDVADVVEITKAEDPNHNGFYTIATVTDQVLTFNATMLGKDNANDETMIITLRERT